MNKQSMKFQIDHNLEMISSGCRDVGYDFYLRFFNLKFVYFHKNLLLVKAQCSYFLSHFEAGPVLRLFLIFGPFSASMFL